MDLLKSVFLDTVSDSVGMLPVLFATFLILELLENYSGPFISRILPKINKAGPAAGALFGCIPQCGFSIMASNLYSGGFITIGTLLAVFLSTSDEALLILLANPGRGKDIFFLLASKLMIAITAGYLVDRFFLRKSSLHTTKAPSDIRMGLHHHDGLLRPVVLHTAQLFAYIFIFSLILNLFIEFFGIASISAFLLGDTIFQPLLAAFIGFIPNCAASVILTELYLQNAISFASVIAGLCTNAGLGLVVLFRTNKNKKENLKIAGLLYVISAIAGILLSSISF